MSVWIWIVIILSIISIGSIIFAIIMIRRHKWIRDLYHEVEDELPDILYPLTLPLFGLFMALGVLSALWKSENNKEEL